MYCVRCGRALVPEAVFCAFCGLPVQAVAGANPAPPVPAVPAAVPPRRRVSRPLLGIALLLAIFAGTVGLGTLGWLGSERPEAAIFNSASSPALIKSNVTVTLPPLQPDAPTSIEAVALSLAQRSVVLVSTSDGHGTGIVLTEDGQILTSMHVVTGEEDVRVRTTDGRWLEATVVRSAEWPDLALLRVRPGRGLSPASWADSDRLYLGQPVWIVGHALDEEWSPTISRGVVSAFRTEEGIKYIQTDAAMNPGCSGGPLLDLNGAVVGISDWSIDESDGRIVQGMNFAIAGSEARRWLERSGGR